MGATMKDIARETGLGLATISSYLNGGNVREKNRVKIEEAIEKLHFEVNEVARGLKTNRTKTIGIILPELNNIFFSEIITAAEDLLRSHGYATMICDCRSDVKREEEAAEFLLHRRVDGLIMMPTGAEKKVLNKFRKSRRPVVLIDRRMENGDCDCVLVDNEGAAQNAVKRLMKKGHKKIGMITGPDNVYTARERQRGYELAMQESSKARKDIKLLADGNYTIAGGAKAMRKLYEDNPDMTAVFISNYEMTVGAMMEINDLGIKVPEQLSVIGFDNMDFARAVVPRLTIVTQPTEEIGQAAANLLLSRLEDKDETLDKTSDKTSDKTETTETIWLKTGFVEGKSVADIS
ncbi:LacI family DNA-binding transcriptional regulator [Mediterraneibacter faecis]|uniref:LacI family DNA-binding transcriptional regulator n=1 Tax=Mediterraneibacter faecis TaxID=592978 RepID=UPI0032BFACC7